MAKVAREFHLASRPDGWPTPENFRLVEAPLPDPGPDEVLVRNLFISVDPYMRGRMSEAKSYLPPYAIGEPMDGGAVGEVMASADTALAPGDTVVHNLGWRDYALGPAKRFRKVDPAPGLTAHLGVLGATGFTAYVGLLDIAALKPGDVVFVSGAAGAVGSVAGQIAKLRGAARVVGSAGSPAKVDYVTKELGFDAAFDYHDGPVRAQLRDAAPDGIDVYFDNVGGEHLEAAIGVMHDFGRAALCGAISHYNASSPTRGPRNMGLVVSRRLTLRGYIILDHPDRRPAFVEEMSGWLRAGKVRSRETIVDGLENAPEAFLGMLRGDNTGKMLVRL
jgi:NADPH-dependent curcumin reductase CurA